VDQFPDWYMEAFPMGISFQKRFTKGTLLLKERRSSYKWEDVRVLAQKNFAKQFI